MPNATAEQTALIATLSKFNGLTARLSGDVARAIDPASIIAVLTSVREILSSFCPGMSAMQTAASMKAPTASMRRKHWKVTLAETRAEFAEDFDESRPRRQGKQAVRQWKQRRRDWEVEQELLINDVASRVYEADNLALAEATVEDVALSVEETRERLNQTPVSDFAPDGQSAHLAV